MKRNSAKLIALLLTLCTLLSACIQNGQDDPAIDPIDEPLALTICAGDRQDTLDPAHSTADGSEMILLHLYENLMRWEDDGNGFATLVPGQAASYTVALDYAGNATYTFTLRDDILWSDGSAVTSFDFVDAWRRLADGANASPHRELMSNIAGYDDVQESGDASLLAVSAPDARTFIVTLNGNAPYFLEEVCASAYTMPVRQDLPESGRAAVITNGAYTLTESSPSLITLTKSGTYYDAAHVTAQTLRFAPSSGGEADYEKLLNGDAHLVEDLPASVLQELAGNGTWTSEPITTTVAVVLNTLQPPFDSADIRAAFRLVVDEQAVVNALGDYTSRAAIGLVPYGVTDFGVRNIETEVEPRTTEETMPDPNNPPKEKAEKIAVYWDFRAHSQEIVTLDTSTDYSADCSYARALLAGAGYGGGKGFPAVEYIYVDSQENKVIAQALQSMWQEQLGVTVTLRALTQEEYDLMLVPAESEDEDIPPIAPFQMAAMELTAAYNDASALLFRWHSAGENNCAGYASAAFDILLGAAEAAVSPESYDAYLHDAEAILLEDAPVIPICYRGGSYQLADGLEGLYRAPNGVYFLTKVKKTQQNNQF